MRRTGANADCFDGDEARSRGHARISAPRCDRPRDPGSAVLLLIAAGGIATTSSTGAQQAQNEYYQACVLKKGSMDDHKPQTVDKAK
jgi:hypothetical protein